MPALTVAVVVAPGDQAFVGDCLRSVLDQHPTDLELIAVDDGTSDHARGILDALALQDERLRVLHQDRPIGLAAARALALEHARGDHVWFVEAADRLVPGALAGVAAALEALAPDVLLVGHTRISRAGRPGPGPGRRVLARLAEAGPGPLDARPGAAACARSAWDKVFRRELLTTLATPPAPDVALVWPALLAADRIAARPAAVYERHTARAAAGAGGGPDAYDAVFAFADARPDMVPDARRRLVLPAMRDHLLSQLERAPKGERAAVLDGAAQALRRHRRGDEPAPRGRTAVLRARIAERGDLRAWELFETARRRATVVRRARAALSRRRARLSKARGKRRADRRYRAALSRPVDPDLAVFAAYWYRGYSCNPRAIYEKARELVPRMRGVWVVERDAVATVPDGVEHVVAGTPEYFDVIARAAYFVNNVNFPDHLVKRAGTVHVMTHHGTPLKRMGLDLRETPIAGRRMNFEALMRRCARWDYSVSSNPLSTLTWERVYPTRHQTLEVGYPRNDVLVTATEDDVARIRAGLGIAPGRTAVLYAPTHREYRSGYVPTMDVAAVAGALAPEHVLLARLHYFYDEDPLLRELHEAGSIIDVARHPSVEELCLAADLLVTDYSSIMFDYAVLDRPIVIHAPDWEVYRAMRGTYFDLMEEPPGVVARDDEGVVEAIRSGAAAGEPARMLRATFRERFCPWDDGHAAERVVRRVWLGERQPAPAPTPAGAR